MLDQVIAGYSGHPHWIHSTEEFDGVSGGDIKSEDRRIDRGKRKVRGGGQGKGAVVV